MAEQTSFRYSLLPQNDRFSLDFKSTVSEKLFRFGGASGPVTKIRDGTDFERIDNSEKYSCNRSRGECASPCVLAWIDVSLMFFLFFFYEELSMSAVSPKSSFVLMQYTGFRFMHWNPTHFNHSPQRFDRVLSLNRVHSIPCYKVLEYVPSVKYKFVLFVQWHSPYYNIYIYFTKQIRHLINKYSLNQFEAEVQTDS